MINPDGINLVNNFYDKNSNVYISVSNIAKNFPSIPFPSGWKANINGVDLNSQFPADWETGKKIKSNFGFLSYSPSLKPPKDEVYGVSSSSYPLTCANSFAISKEFFGKKSLYFQ